MNLFQFFMASSWPDDVGIAAAEVYFPNLYVDQTDLEKEDNCEGKYTKGLGQEKMAIATDAEDVVSLSLTVTHRLLRRNAIETSDIGYVSVGTESAIDKSKAVKTNLMILFDENTNIAGVDSLNACYGGTEALFNAVNWMESSSWDGRKALVVMADIAVYSKGVARPTGGAGAVAFLISPNAPIIFERKLRATYMAHNWDFYKPVSHSEYPIVDGVLSLKCYLEAFDKCYVEYVRQAKGQNLSYSSDDFVAVCCHSPFSKLVQKGISRLFFHEERQKSTVSELKSFTELELSETYNNGELEKLLVRESLKLFNRTTLPSLYLAKAVGNMYAPSLYAALISSLLLTPLCNLLGKRLLLFSYGSGSASSMFSLRCTSDEAKLSPLHNNLQQVNEMLSSRRRISIDELNQIMKVREEAIGKAPYEPRLTSFPTTEDTFYLSNVDEKYRRFYSLSGLPDGL